MAGVLTGMPLASLTSAPLALSPALQLLVPVLALAYPQPTRPRFALRALLVLLLYTVFVAVAYVPARLSQAQDPVSFDWPVSLVSSIALMLVTVPAVLFLHRTGLWNAVFCVSAGYVIQNIASGAEALLDLLLARQLGMAVTPAPAAAVGGIIPYLASAPAHVPVFLASFLGVYVLAYLLFVRRIWRSGLGDVENRGMVAVFALVILAVIAFDVLIKDLTQRGDPLPELVALRAVHGAVCVFILLVAYEMLYSKRLEADVATTQAMLAERERQYELSRANIEAINVKCHDIRHQIRHLADKAGATVMVDPGVLDDIAREVDVYDSTVKTGNEALDTVLTEKGLMCRREGITLTCIADGHALDFMEPAEIYAFFGNALENAIRAERAATDPDRRSITLQVRRTGTLATVHMENYFVGTLQFTDGMPRTTQQDEASHGFGTRSMRMICERHGGTITFTATGSTFRVNAMMPIPA